MMGDMGSFSFGMGSMGLIFMFLFWGFVIFVIIAIIKWLSGSRSGGQDTSSKTTLDILKERYARGEIDREEFEQKRKDIED